MSDSSPSRFPDGIGERLDDPPRGWRKRANLLSLLVLGAVVAVGLSGLAGGRDDAPLKLGSPAATMTVETRRTLRTGEFFETRISIAAHQPLDDAVFAISRSLWREKTINTVTPAPVEERGVDGRFAHAFGPLEAGKTLDIKIDGQVNPSSRGVAKGSIALLDGERLLAEQPLTIRILP